MRLLLDSCVSSSAIGELEAAGHVVEWTGAWNRDPGDEEILRIAFETGRVLVTLDKDFGELAVVRGRPHAGIVRMVGFSVREQAAACVELLAKYDREIASGALVTAERNRVRVRPGA